MQNLRDTGRMPRRRALILLGLFASVAFLGLVWPAVFQAGAQTSSEYNVQSVLTAEVLDRFQQPRGLFYNFNSGQLLVGDSGKRRLVFYREADGVLTASKEVELKDGLGPPVHFVQTSEGRIIFSDQLEQRVKVLYGSGKLSHPLDLSQVTDHDSIMPGALVLDRSGQLYLVDETNSRILVFDAKGRYQRAVRPDDPALKGINAIAVDSKSNLYALDTLGGAVYLFSPDGKLYKKFGQRGPKVDEFDFPVDLAVDRKGYTYVLDQHRGTIVVFNQQQRYQANIGSRGWDKGELLFPTSIVIDDKNRIYVADRENRRVQVYLPKEEK